MVEAALRKKGFDTNFFDGFDMLGAAWVEEATELYGEAMLDIVDGNSGTLKHNATEEGARCKARGSVRVEIVGRASQRRLRSQW